MHLGCFLQSRVPIHRNIGLASLCPALSCLPAQSEISCYDSEPVVVHSSLLPALPSLSAQQQVFAPPMLQPPAARRRRQQPVHQEVGGCGGCSGCVRCIAWWRACRNVRTPHPTNGPGCCSTKSVCTCDWLGVPVRASARACSPAACVVSGHRQHHSRPIPPMHIVHRQQGCLGPVLFSTGATGRCAFC